MRHVLPSVSPWRDVTGQKRRFLTFSGGFSETGVFLGVFGRRRFRSGGGFGVRLVVAQGRTTTILLGLLAAACGLTGAQAVRPAGSTLTTKGAPALVTKTALLEEPVADEVRAPLDLSQFRPLLARPEYASIQELIAAGQPARAAEEFASIVKGLTEEGLDRARHEYALGLLQLEAENETLAALSFERAGKFDWVLAEDARLRSAELLLRAGQPEVALTSWEGLSALKGSTRAQSVRASALSSLKRLDEAVDVWRALLQGSESAVLRLELARALLAQAEQERPGDVRKKLALEAALEIEKARLGKTPDDDISPSVLSLLNKAVSYGAPANVHRTVKQELAHLKGLIEEKSFEEAERATLRIAIEKEPRYSPERCEFDYLRGKLLAAQTKWGEAADRIASSAENCTQDPELHAWLLFNAGKYSSADGRETKAVHFYEELERLYPKNSLADDARLRAAKSYQAQGVTARFVSLLLDMPESYPDGDMTREGVMELALYRIERNDWSGAAQVLERAARVVRDRDSERGHEYSGTERYFLARARQELGQEEPALLEYESIVRELPLSYYMLHAYSRLLEADPARARKALDEGVELAQKTPFEFPHRPEYDTPEFQRGMELLRVGDVEEGKRVLDALGLDAAADDALLWGMALLYDRAGDAHTSHGIARERLTDWFAHYPEGSWLGPWQIGFPRPYHAIVERESKATGIPEWFIYGVMREESTFRPTVVSHADAYGLMQIILPTARGIAKKSGHPATAGALKQPSVNIAIGSRVLKDLGSYFRENPWLAIPGYNAGPGRPKRWLSERPNVDFDVWVEMIPFRETRRYTKRVLASRAAYAFVYYRDESQTALVLPKRLTYR